MTTAMYLVTSPRQGYKRMPLELCAKCVADWLSHPANTVVKDNATNYQEFDGEACEGCEAEERERDLQEYHGDEY